MEYICIRYITVLVFNEAVIYRYNFCTLINTFNNEKVSFTFSPCIYNHYN